MDSNFEDLLFILIITAIIFFEELTIILLMPEYSLRVFLQKYLR